MSGAWTLLNHSGSCSSFPMKEQVHARNPNIHHRPYSATVRCPAAPKRDPLLTADGTLIQLEGGDDVLNWATVGHRRHRRGHQPLWFACAAKSSTPDLGEGSSAALALVAALFLVVDHYVSIAETPVGTAASVVAASTKARMPQDPHVVQLSPRPRFHEALPRGKPDGQHGPSDWSEYALRQMYQASMSPSIFSRRSR